MWDKSHPFVTKPCGPGSPKRTNPLGVGLRCKAKNGEDPDTPHLSNTYVKFVFYISFYVLKNIAINHLMFFFFFFLQD